MLPVATVTPSLLSSAACLAAAPGPLDRVSLLRRMLSLPGAKDLGEMMPFELIMRCQGTFWL